jgi:hypothetical protein
MDEERSQFGGVREGQLGHGKELSGQEALTSYWVQMERLVRTPRKIGRVGGTHPLGGTMGRNNARRSYALESQWESGYQTKASTTSKTRVLLKKGGTSHDVET